MINPDSARRRRATGFLRRTRPTSWPIRAIAPPGDGSRGCFRSASAAPKRATASSGFRIFWIICEGLNLIVMPPARIHADAAACASDRLKQAASRRGLARGRHALSRRRLRGAWRGSPTLPTAPRVPLIAVNDVLYHAPERRALQDVVTCIREHTHAGRRRASGLKPMPSGISNRRRKWRGCFGACPEAIGRDGALSRQAAISRSRNCAAPNMPTKRGKATPRRRMRWSPSPRRDSRSAFPTARRSRSGMRSMKSCG